jgi:hypothetical protein
MKINRSLICGCIEKEKLKSKISGRSFRKKRGWRLAYLYLNSTNWSLGAEQTGQVSGKTPSDT